MKSSGIPSLALFAIGSIGILHAATSSEAPPSTAVFKQYCQGCHGKAATAGINLEKLTSAPMADNTFYQWQKVASVLEEKRMPPAKLPQPPEADRAAAINWVRASLKSYSEKRAGAHQRGIRLHHS